MCISLYNDMSLRAAGTPQGSARAPPGVREVVRHSWNSTGGQGADGGLPGQGCYHYFCTKFLLVSSVCAATRHDTGNLGGQKGPTTNSWNSAGGQGAVVGLPWIMKQWTLHCKYVYISLLWYVFACSWGTTKQDTGTTEGQGGRMTQLKLCGRWRSWWWLTRPRVPGRASPRPRSSSSWQASSLNCFKLWLKPYFLIIKQR